MSSKRNKLPCRYQIRRDDALMGGYWYVLFDALKDDKVLLEVHSNNPVCAPANVRTYQARLNSKYTLDTLGIY